MTQGLSARGPNARACREVRDVTGSESERTCGYKCFS